MKPLAISYARALYEAAKENQTSAEQLDQFEKQLDQIVSVLNSSRETSIAMYGPIATVPEKLSFIKEIAKRLNLAALVHRFLDLLVKKQRLLYLGEIRDAFASVRLSYEGGVSGTLVSAEAVSDSDVAELSKAFGKKLGKKVSFRVSTDPSLLAGVKVTVNGVTYDGTLRSQIQKLRDQVRTGLPVNAL